MFAIFTWLVHWRQPINTVRILYGVEITEGSSYRLLLLFNKKRWPYSKSKRNIIYPNIPSPLRPVERDDSLPYPKQPQQWALHEEEPNSNSTEDEPGPSCTNMDPDFPELTVCHLISQSEINDFARDLNISRIQAGFLASRLQEWNLLQQGAKVSYKKRLHSLSSFLSKGGGLVCCNDV
jgi:hypothetical protein